VSHPGGESCCGHVVTVTGHLSRPYDRPPFITRQSLLFEDCPARLGGCRSWAVTIPDRADKRLRRFLTADGPVRGAKADRMADLQPLIAQAETRLADVRVHLPKQEPRPSPPTLA
jgi:hypothetical protein